MKDLPLSTDPPAAPRLTPRIAPGRSPNAPFGQQAARGPTRCLSDPPHCAGKRADRPEGKSSRKTPDLPSRPFTARAYSHGRRPAPDDWRPLREAIARGLHEATPAILAFARLPWMHRSPTKGTEVLDNPTLTRTMVTLRELDHRRNKKVKYSRKISVSNFRGRAQSLHKLSPVRSTGTSVCFRSRDSKNQPRLVSCTRKLIGFGRSRAVMAWSWRLSCCVAMAALTWRRRAV